MRERSTVWHFVGCSTAPFEGNAGCRTTSAPTTIHFIGSTSGKPISARFDGNPTVEPYTKHQSLPDFSKTRARCGIPVNLGTHSQRNRSVFEFLGAARFYHRVNSPETGLTLL
jgi:hypothetical protein